MIRTRAALLATVAVVLVIDLATKANARQSVAVYYNPGVAAGFLDGRPVIAGLVSAVAAVAISIMAWRWTGSVAAAIGWGLVAGGGLGNLIDRYLFSGRNAVTDWIQTSPQGPYFNLADVAIRLGTILLLASFAISWFRTLVLARRRRASS